jgi:nucleotide-binding universal stress UspA family protein
MYSKIIVPLDNSALAECALPHAEALARGLGIKLVLLQVVPYPEITDAAMEADWASKARDYLDDLAEDLKTGGVTNVEVEILWGEMPKTIIDYAQSDEKALVVMSTHGRTGLSKLAYGSVTESVLHEATGIPVLIVRCPAEAPSEA